MILVSILKSKESGLEGRNVYEYFRKVQPIETMLPERYYTMSTEDMEKRVREIKEKMGKMLFIPGHHYQKDEVVQFSDAAGDSLQLAQVARAIKTQNTLCFAGYTLWRKQQIC